MNLPNVKYLGHVAVFYIPEFSLDIPIQSTGMTARQMLHDFFLAQYSAYTHEISDIKGFWHSGKQLFVDKHERFEVSFDGEEKVAVFVNFLSRLCRLIGEEALYLTMGYKSWLVLPEVEINDASSNDNE